MYLLEGLRNRCFSFLETNEEAFKSILILCYFQASSKSAQHKMLSPRPSNSSNLILNLKSPPMFYCSLKNPSRTWLNCTTTIRFSTNRAPSFWVTWTFISFLNGMWRSDHKIRKKPTNNCGNSSQKHSTVKFSTPSNTVSFTIRNSYFPELKINSSCKKTNSKH
jgi:hypothetical protein